MTASVLFEVLMTWGAVLLIFGIWDKFIRRKKVFVIDDDSTDLSLYKLHFRLDDSKFDVRYYSSVKGLALKIALDTPDIVIVDYMLKDNVNGDQVYKFCKRNGIKCVIVTGYDGHILDVKPEDIIRKDPNQEFYKQLESVVMGCAI